MWCCCGLLGVCFVCVVFCFFTREIIFQSLPFPVVDRPCLVLVRHCRKKKYLAALPTLRHGVIAAVCRNKGAALEPTRDEKQLFVFLPNDLSLDDWYAGVYALPTVRPDVSMLGADNLRKVAGYDFHLLRKNYDVQSMWGDLDPQWRLLKKPKGETGTRSLSAF